MLAQYLPMPTSASLVPSAALFASGLAGVLIPERVVAELELDPRSPRGIAEARVGLGGTYAGLGAVGLLARTRSVDAAIGATWLGAAITRVLAIRLDPHRRRWTFWAYLLGEFGLGSMAMASALRPARTPPAQT
jgi:hypothetical protein